MADPSKKDKSFENFLDKYSHDVYGRSRTESIKNNICLNCGEMAIIFRDSLSRKEYNISGFCQKCQDKIFKLVKEMKDAKD